MKPEKIGTVWTAIATAWVIIDTKDKPIRRNLASCIDTPEHIRQMLATLRKAGHKNLWTTGTASDKQYHG